MNKKALSQQLIAVIIISIVIVLLVLTVVVPLLSVDAEDIVNPLESYPCRMNTAIRNSAFWGAKQVTAAFLCNTPEKVREYDVAHYSCKIFTDEKEEQCNNEMGDKDREEYWKHEYGAAKLAMLAKRCWWMAGSGEYDLGGGKLICYKVRIVDSNPADPTASTYDYQLGEQIVVPESVYFASGIPAYEGPITLADVKSARYKTDGGHTGVDIVFHFDRPLDPSDYINRDGNILIYYNQVDVEGYQTIEFTDEEDFCDDIFSRCY